MNAPRPGGIGNLPLRSGVTSATDLSCSITEPGQRHKALNHSHSNSFTVARQFSNEPGAPDICHSGLRHMCKSNMDAAQWSWPALWVIQSFCGYGCWVKSTWGLP
ncbi:hypothetical protein CEXT_617711 [Caerostris extrusa]|uniref:Uncharacterized protein n=1 Tax=Caerostris extrusa TaxID=172846 RepID=A0AAV4PUU4_CAEEX|nr:hypothetical protein CEXT_617711 [Caerostris extrusa]